MPLLPTLKERCRIAPVSRPDAVSTGHDLPGCPRSAVAAQRPQPARRKLNRRAPALLLVGLFGFALRAVGTPLELHQADHICLIGNALADRMQHSGWLETLIYSRFPKLDLVFRDLGFSGDELTVRARSQDFGTPDEWLQREKADVVLAFFGYNESFQGPAGLAQFRHDLEAFIDHTLAQNYSGRGAARLVLFSPITQEQLPDPNFSDPAANNANLRLYTTAMAEVAKAKGVPFVDLYAASTAAYAKSPQPLTINGVHLTDAGYRALAPAMYAGLFGEPAPAMDGAAFEKLRSAINDKNRQFFRRYRTVDGFNIYGGRSHLEYNGVKNRDTMLREMDMRDVMTANRDRRVWAVAQGGDLVVKDDNLPLPVEVKSNHPGPNPDGSFTFLSGEAAIRHMQVPPGCKVNLFASEEQFPELANPVQMAFDTRGRLWVAAWPNYPERTPQSQKGDSLLVFEDTDGDGKADQCSAFIDDLNAPTGFQFYRDGVIVVQAPDVWFVRDTDGNGKADWRERLLDGLDSADAHHTANSLVLDPGGAIYLSDGVFHRTQVETPWGPPVRNEDACIYRFEPRTGKFERYIPYGFANPHGRVFDYWGNDLVTDATGNNTYFGPAFSGHLDYPDKHAGLREFWNRPSRPCPGTGILSSRHFPESFQGEFLNCNVIGYQGIFRVKVREEGSGLWGDTVEPGLVQSDDPNFRPTAVDVAPDGSVYFLDWQNPIIGHMQHHLRDPNRDHTHGRIYRLTYPSRPLLQPAKIAGEPIPKLLELLKEPENNVRTRAKIELGARDPQAVIAAVQQWVQQFDPAKTEDQHPLMEALWVHQWLNVVDEPLLRQMLHSPEPRARAAAVRVLGYWRDRVREPLALLRDAANDPAPRVRLEAVRVLSFFRGHEALAIAHEVLKYDTDYYLDYTFNETLRQLRKTTDELYLPENPKALARVLERLSNAELMRAPASEPVLLARVERKGIEINARNQALTDLAKLHGSDRIAETIAALNRFDRDGADWSVVKDLATLLTAISAELTHARAPLADLARHAHRDDVRRAAYAGLVATEGKPDGVWAETADQATARVALIDSIILVADPDTRALFEPLLTEAIANSATSAEVRRAALRALPLMGSDFAAQNFTLLAAHLRNGRELPTVSRAILQMPREVWDKAAAAPVADAILRWARNVPAADRTAQDYVETVQLGMEMATLLPPADNTRVRKALLGLGVRVFAIKSVREQMRYDTTRIVVEAGKPFEIRFENVDMMPHNLTIVRPGAREEVGKQAEKMPPNPDSQGRLYVPDNPKILAATRLLEPGERATLKLTAPEAPGDYEYLCTYPEHWKVMFGQLVVVKDLEAYLAASATAPLPPTPPPLVAHEHHH